MIWGALGTKIQCFSALGIYRKPQITELHKCFHTIPTDLPKSWKAAFLLHGFPTKHIFLVDEAGGAARAVIHAHAQQRQGTGSGVGVGQCGGNGRRWERKKKRKK